MLCFAPLPGLLLSRSDWIIDFFYPDGKNGYFANCVTGKAYDSNSSVKISSLAHESCTDVNYTYKITDSLCLWHLFWVKRVPCESKNYIYDYMLILWYYSMLR